MAKKADYYCFAMRKESLINSSVLANTRINESCAFGGSLVDDKDHQEKMSTNLNNKNTNALRSQHLGPRSETQCRLYATATAEVVQKASFVNCSRAGKINRQYTTRFPSVSSKFKGARLMRPGVNGYMA